jgi:hypothetical protein
MSSQVRVTAYRRRIMQNKANLRSRVRSVPVRAFRETPYGVTTSVQNKANLRREAGVRRRQPEAADWGKLLA